MERISEMWLLHLQNGLALLQHRLRKCLPYEYVRVALYLFTESFRSLTFRGRLADKLSVGIISSRP
jgi:hypothetical protein